MALNFDGTGDWLDVPTSTDFDLSVFSVSLWVNSSASSANNYQLIGRNDATAGRNGFFLSAVGDAFTIRTRAGGAPLSLIQSAVGALDGTWKQVGGVIRQASGGQLRLYVDGVEVGGGDTNSGAWSFSSQPIYIAGRANTTFFDELPGDIMEAAWWTGELSAASFAALANGYSPSMIEPDSLIEYWPIGGSVSPEPGLVNGNNGTLVGNPTKVAGHRILRPAAQILQFPPVAAGGGGVTIPVLLNSYRQRNQFSIG